ncbi:MAG: DNA-binding protein [Deltaproteobacteria bacterium]|nr:DNA-binding protein [Deltaproteobacteria bacterium]
MAKQGVSKEEVLSAINTIVGEGQKPTIARIRQLIGGSPNRLLVFLREWRDSKPLLEQSVAETSAALRQILEQLEKVVAYDLEKAVTNAKSEVETDLLEERKETESLSQLCDDWENKNEDLEAKNAELNDENNKFFALNAKLTADLEQLKVEQKLEKDALEKALSEQRDIAANARTESAKIAVKLEDIPALKQQIVDLQKLINDSLLLNNDLEKKVAVLGSERANLTKINDKQEATIETLTANLQTSSLAKIEADKQVVILATELKNAQAENEKIATKLNI